MKKEFQVYDKVWVIYNNNIKEKIIYSKTGYMNFLKNGIDYNYTLVNGVLGAGVNPNKGIPYTTEEIFKTKQELIDSL